MKKLKLKRLGKVPRPKNWLYLSALAVFIIAFIGRIGFMSHGMDQGDVVLYRNSLVHMSFFREAQWPLLLLFQKSLWLVLPGLSAQQVLSLTSIILGAATLALFFGLARRISGSYVISSILSFLLFIMPLFGVYSVIGMQDMPQAFAVTAFVAVVLRFCYSKRVEWLYAASAVAGLALGVRETLILVVPSLILAALLVIGIKPKVYWRAAGAFVAGAFIGLGGDLFIPPLKNSNPVGFFLSQFHMFNPSVLGYWVKAGDYTLFSGYKLTIFYWLPLLWFLVYLIARRQRAHLKSGPIIALIASFLSLGVAFGLNRILKAPPAAWVYLLEIIILGLAMIYELVKFWPNLRRSNYFKKIEERERVALVLTCLIITYVVFEYIFTGPVTRYLLPIIPAALLLGLLLISRYGWKTWATIFIVAIFVYWASPWAQSQRIVGTFKQLDPRSAMAEYVAAHNGKYYNFDITSTAGGYLETFGAVNRTATPFGLGCGPVNTSQKNYAIFYGVVDPSLAASCPNLSFVPVAKFQRNEEVIEDTVGNLGYTIYQILPR